VTGLKSKTHYGALSYVIVFVFVVYARVVITQYRSPELESHLLWPVRRAPERGGAATPHTASRPPPPAVDLTSLLLRRLACSSAAQRRSRSSCTRRRASTRWSARPKPSSSSTRKTFERKIFRFFQIVTLNSQRMIFLSSLLVRVIAATTFDVQNNSFILNGSPVLLKSSCLHYYRIPRSHIVSRIRAVKSLGLNTIEMYIPVSWM
jgi:hypothetical protein